MRATLGVLVAGLGFLMSAVPVLGHHSFAAEYDATKPVTLKGVVTKLEWTNPHARFYVDVKDEKGTVTNWNLELASPNMMQRNGWTRHALKEGDQVVVVATRAKDGTNTAATETITKSDGTVLTFMAAPDGVRPTSSK